MSEHKLTIKDIEPLAPFSRGSTGIFLTGRWSPKKPVYVEKTSPCRHGCPIGNDISRAFAHASKGDYDVGAQGVPGGQTPSPACAGESVIIRVRSSATGKILTKRSTSGVSNGSFPTTAR